MGLPGAQYVWHIRGRALGRVNSASSGDTDWSIGETLPSVLEVSVVWRIDIGSSTIPARYRQPPPRMSPLALCFDFHKALTKAECFLAADSKSGMSRHRAQAEELWRSADCVAYWSAEIQPAGYIWKIDRGVAVKFSSQTPYY